LLGGLAVKTAIPVILIAACLCAPAAQAQQADKFASGLATAMEGLGQSLGQSAVGGDSLFVTATGRAPLPSGPRLWYTTTLEARDASAVEAAQTRDKLKGAIEAAAKRFGVDIETQSYSFAIEPSALCRKRPSCAPPPSPMAPTAPPGLVMTPPSSGDQPQAEPKFVAKATLKFAPTHPERFAEFLDAARAAGADNLEGGPGAASPLNIFQNNTLLGAGSVDQVDEAVWDQASRAAMAAARHQAEVLAAASGRSLGETREVMSLNRGVQGPDATVTLAVRFAFAPVK